MNIIIIGAGQVGSSVAKILHEEHSLSLIDPDTDKLRTLQNKYDIKTVCGSGSYPHILEEANAQDADMLIAVSNNDQVNIVACQIAYSLFKTPTKIARLRNKAFAKYPQLFNNDNIPIDLIINPAELVTKSLLGLLEYPNCFQVVDFAQQKLVIAGMQINPSSSACRMKVMELTRDLGDIDARIVAVYRQKTPLDVHPELVLEARDDVYYLAHRKDVSLINLLFESHPLKVRRVMIAGAGHIGTSFAKSIENDYQVGQRM